MKENCVHLHVHTEYSLNEGICTTRKLLDRARKHKMPALAITYEAVFYGVIEFFEYAVQNWTL